MTHPTIAKLQQVIVCEQQSRKCRVFGGGAEIWMRMQASYDLAQAREHEGGKVCRIKFSH